jgi:DNA polymerase-4
LYDQVAFALTWNFGIRWLRDDIAQNRSCRHGRFLASVEQRDDPHLRGKPVVVAWRGNRSVVCAASYEARRFGVRSAMPAVRAEHLCPSAVFLPPDFPRYRAVSHQVREIFKRHADLIEPLSLDEAYLDVSKNKTRLPTATQVARSIREQIRTELSLTASAGVAPINSWQKSRPTGENQMDCSSSNRKK